MDFKEEKKINFWQKLRNKYRLSIYNTSNFEEVFTINLSRLNVFIILGSAILIIAIIITGAFVYTPLKEMIPGYPDGKVAQKLVLNEIKLDSIEHQLLLKQKYIDNLKLILSGGTPDEYISDTTSIKTNDTNNSDVKLEFKKSKEDSMLRAEIEKEERFSVNVNTSSKPKLTDIKNVQFFPPVTGIVTGKYSKEKNHLAIDIVGKKNQPIVSVLNGHVIFVGQTQETGNVIYIQHSNNLLSVYKHVKDIKVKQGEYVKQGEVIALMGNTGEITSGPHLHFELWHNGIALNPIDYINFE